MKLAMMIALSVWMIYPCLAWSQVVGGFREVSTKDKRMLDAVEFAIDSKKKEKVTLVKVVKAEQQVVAGMNYRVTLDVKLDDKAKTATAVIWSKLDGSYKLTDWKWIEEPAKDKKEGDK